MHKLSRASFNGSTLEHDLISWTAGPLLLNGLWCSSFGYVLVLCLVEGLGEKGHGVRLWFWVQLEVKVLSLAHASAT